MPEPTREPSRRRLPRLIEPYGREDHPEALDETVVHDPSGRPWLVCTSDLLYGSDGAGGADAPILDEALERSGRFETHVYYTARAGIRGFPTGHGERYHRRDEALAGHRRWCLGVRSGLTFPDQVPDDPL